MKIFKGSIFVKGDIFLFPPPKTSQYQIPNTPFICLVPPSPQESFNSPNFSNLNTLIVPTTFVTANNDDATKISDLDHGDRNSCAMYSGIYI